MPFNAVLRSEGTRKLWHLQRWQGIELENPTVIVKCSVRKTKQEINKTRNISCVPLSGPGCWVGWFLKPPGVKAERGARGHRFPSRLTWGPSSHSRLPTSVFHGGEVDRVPVKLCSISELEWSCCGAKRGGSGEERRRCFSPSRWPRQSWGW